MSLQPVLAKYNLVVASRFKRYREMFKFLDVAVGNEKTKDIANMYLTVLDSNIKNYIKSFKRSDAIIWVLRKSRDNIKARLGLLPEDKQASAKKEWTAFINAQVGIRNILGEASDNNIQKILNYRFPPHASTHDVMVFLSSAYQKWKNDADVEKRALKEGNETFLKFADGWEWQIIPEGFCEKEGEAMRHCGNKPSVQEGDELLSLREPVKLKNGKMGWKPHATFVLNADGFLGEMKGFANEKPRKELHKYIVPLLEHDEIKGIRGGGYESRNNFSLLDLEKEQQFALTEKKPDLATPMIQFQMFGLTDDLKMQLRDEFSLEDDDFLPKGEPVMDHWYAVVSKFEDLDYFAASYDSNLHEALDYLASIPDVIRQPGIDPEQFFELLNFSDEDRVLKAIEHRYGEKIKEYSEAISGAEDMTQVEIILSMLKDKELPDVAAAIEMAPSAALQEAVAEKVRAEIEHYLDHYEFLVYGMDEHGNGDSYESSDLHLMYDDKDWQKPVRIAMDVKALIQLMEDIDTLPDFSPASDLDINYEGIERSAKAHKYLAKGFLQNI